MSALHKIWGRLPARSKRWAVVSGGIGGLVLALWLVIPAETTQRTVGARRQGAISEIMVSNNTRAVTIDGLAAQVQTLLSENQDIRRRMEEEKRRSVAVLEAQAQQLRREIEAAHGRAGIQERNRLRDLERRIAELGGTPPAPLPPEDATPTASQASQDTPAPAASPPAGERPAADPIAFAGQPPGRLNLQAGLPPPPPPSPLGDLSPTAVFAAPPPRVEPMVTPAGGAATPPQVRRPGATPVATGGTIRYIAPPAVERQNRDLPRRAGQEAFLPSGAILSGVILAGFDAPTSRTARRDPLPALIRLDDLAILPNRFKADVRECFILVSGFGDLSSERSYMRGETFSCVLHDGTVVQERIQAYAAGEDGKAGVRGRLVTKQGQFVARALIVGLMQGVAEAFSQSRGVTIGVAQGGGFSFEGAQSNLGTGLARGSGRALDRIAQFYLDQAGDVFPIIEIAAGRRVDIILTAGATLRLPG